MLLIDICSMENQKGNMKACPPSLTPFHSGSDVPKSPLSGRRNGSHKNSSSHCALGLRSQCAFQSLMSLFWDVSCPLQCRYKILSGALRQVPNSLSAYLAVLYRLKISEMRQPLYQENICLHNSDRWWYIHEKYIWILEKRDESYLGENIRVSHLNITIGHAHTVTGPLAVPSTSWPQLEVDSTGYPKVPTSLKLSSFSKRDLEDLFRQFMSQHYCTCHPCPSDVHWAQHHS